MTKFFIIIVLFFFTFLEASIYTKIKSNKKNFKSSENQKKQTSLKIKDLALQIKSQDSQLQKLEFKISLITKDITTHENMLSKAENKLNSLSKSSSSLKYKKKAQEKEIVNTIIRNFSASISLNLASKDSLQSLIDNEIYNLLSKNSKDKLLRIDNNYMQLSQDKRKNEKNIENISKYIKKRKIKRELFKNLKNKHSKALLSLETKHKLYQKALKKVIIQQKNLSSLLKKLNILKTREEKKRVARIKAAKIKKAKLLASKKRKRSIKKRSQKEITQEYTKEIDLDVRMIGSSTSGIKISKYRGAKTISPLKSYTIVKKFGKYYDSVYKIKLFNESIVLKTKKRQSKVFNILNGKIVYAKKNAGMLENVVIVQHSGGLHTIYSQLDQISPTLRVGKWIKKGYVVGRVNSTLTFQATKNSYHINPSDLFR